MKTGIAYRDRLDGNMRKEEDIADCGLWISKFYV